MAESRLGPNTKVVEGKEMKKWSKKRSHLQTQREKIDPIAKRKLTAMDQGQLVKKVGQDVLLGLKKNCTQLPDNLVGLDDHVKAMMELLNVNSNGMRACGFYPRDGLNALVVRSMIKIEDDNKLRMHDQLRDLGREIVYEENMAKPGKRRRLWCSEQASKLWEGCMLRQLDGPAQLKSVRYLNMHGCWDLEMLLDLSNFKKLKKLDIAWCEKLIEMQGLDRLLHGLLNLRMQKKLDLRGYGYLGKLGEVGVLESLEHLDMRHCKSIERLPDLLNLTKLKKLKLAGCKMLREVKGISVLK
ncbi:hypothetical protein LguiB_031814 [Lonicera macranthoides]